LADLSVEEAAGEMGWEKQGRIEDVKADIY